MIHELVLSLRDWNASWTNWPYSLIDRIIAGEASCLEGIALDVVDAFFDFSLMTRRAGSRGPENESVVLGEGADLGIELGIEPVGLLHGRLEVIQDQPPRCSAKVTEGVLDAAEKVVDCLAIGCLAVSLARVGQHDAEDMSSMALAIGCDN